MQRLRFNREITRINVVLLDYTTSNMDVGANKHSILNLTALIRQTQQSLYHMLSSAPRDCNVLP